MPGGLRFGRTGPGRHGNTPASNHIEQSQDIAATSPREKSSPPGEFAKRNTQVNLMMSDTSQQ
jgi:hypothetical protein